MSLLETAIWVGGGVLLGLGMFAPLLVLMWDMDKVRENGAQDRAVIAENAIVRYGWHDADECFDGCGH